MSSVADTALRLARCFGTSAELYSTCRPTTRFDLRDASPGPTSMRKFDRMRRNRAGALFPLYLCRRIVPDTLFADKDVARATKTYKIDVEKPNPLRV